MKLLHQRNEIPGQLSGSVAVNTPLAACICRDTRTSAPRTFLRINNETMPDGAQHKKQRKAAKVPPADCLAATTEPMEEDGCANAPDAGSEPEERATTPAPGFITLVFARKRLRAWGGFQNTFDWPSPRGAVSDLTHLYEMGNDAYMALTEQDSQEVFDRINHEEEQEEWVEMLYGKREESHLEVRGE